MRHCRKVPTKPWYHIFMDDRARDARGHRAKGFTLIEILVVIAIIGILSSVVMSALNDARTKARDGRRARDIRQIMVALELYYDKYERYPQCTLAIGGDQFCGHCDPYGANEFEQALQPLVDEGFLPSIPRDPKNATGCYTYEYYTNNQSNDWLAQCGGQPLENFPYAMRFGTEENKTLGYRPWNYQRVGGKEYCVVP